MQIVNALGTFLSNHRQELITNQIKSNKYAHVKRMLSGNSFIRLVSRCKKPDLEVEFSAGIRFTFHKNPVYLRINLLLRC